MDSLHEHMRMRMRHYSLRTEQSYIDRPRFQARKTAAVVAAVLDALRVRMGIRAEEFMRESFLGDKPHETAVNVVNPTAAGIVTSGWYSQAVRAHLVLLESANIVQSCSAIHRKTGAPPVFLLYPDQRSNLKPAQTQEIEMKLDQSTWRLERQGLHIAAHHTEEALAAEIGKWAADAISQPLTI